MQVVAYFFHLEEFVEVNVSLVLISRVVVCWK